MARFWVLIIVTFLMVLLTVNYVSKRASQVPVVEAAGASGTVVQAVVPPAPQVPRSDRHEAPSAALYKCVDGKGHLSFQSQRCPADAVQAWVRDATPEPEPSPAQRRQRARAAQAAERRQAPMPGRQVYSSGSASTSQDRSSSSACQIARAADAAYRRQPLRYVTHDGLRRYGDQVNAACY